MVSGLVLFLAGTLLGIGMTAGGIMFFHYVADLKTDLEQMSQKITTVSNYCTNFKDLLEDEFAKVAQRLGRIEKKIDELPTPAEPIVKPDPGDIGNRSV